MLSTRTEREHLEPGEAPAPPQPAPVLSAGLTPASVLALQRAGAGNHAIARILARSGRSGDTRSIEGLANSFGVLGKPTKPQQPQTQTPKPQNKPNPPRNSAPLKQAVEAKIESFVQTQKEVKPSAKLPVLPETADLEAAHKHLVNHAVGWLVHLNYALRRIPVIPENADLRARLEEVLAALKTPRQFNGLPREEAVDKLRDLYQVAMTIYELSEPVPAAATPGVSTDDRLLTVAKRNIRLRMATEVWTGAARGGELDFEVPADAAGFHRKLKAEFHHKAIDRTDWPGRKTGEKAYYYVTEKSNSGFAFDISAHALPKGSEPSQKTLGTTVHVLHIKRKPK